jgi:hypothetical protein
VRDESEQSESPRNTGNLTRVRDEADHTEASEASLK